MKLGLQDLDLKGAKVLLRVDFNVPLDAKGEITDDARIQSSLPSIQYILNQGASLILMSHLGRPKKRDRKDSLAPCAKRLSELLHRPVLLAPDCVGQETKQQAERLVAGEILMLENLRFYEAEEHPEKDPSFAEKLAALGTCYVDDAFGSAHRAHASIVGVPRFFPRSSAAGFLLQKEIEHLGPLLTCPEHPFYAIIGGAKISTKIGVIETLLDKADAVFIGGAMAFSFLKEKGMEIGNSLWEEEATSYVRALLKKRADKIFLPLDLVIADRYAEDAQFQVVDVKEGVKKGWQAMDVGPLTLQKWSTHLQKAKTVFWNGPLGVFEMPLFAKGTENMAHLLSQLKAKVVVGGGDSVAAIMQMGLQSSFAFLSTGGGAALEFLEKGSLPGIEALTNKE